MFEVVSILCPALVSIAIERKCLKKKNFRIDDLINYGIYCLFNNMITVIFMVYIFKVKENMPEMITLYPGVFVKYVVVASIIAMILGFTKVGFVKNVEVEVETKNRKDN